MGIQYKSGLKFLGSGNAFNVKLDNNSAYYIMDKSMFLIDCGGSIFRKILIHELLNDIDEINVLITHTHPDHVGSLGDLIFYSYYKLDININVIYPDIDELCSILNKMGISGYMFNAVRCIDNLNLHLINGKTIEIEVIEQKHIDSLDNYGYIIDIDNFKCFYSGDSNEIIDIVLDRFEEFRFFYQDTCIEELPDNPHLSLNALCKYFEISRRNKIYCMHLDEKFDRKTATDLGFNVVVNEC